MKLERDRMKRKWGVLKDLRIKNRRIFHFGAEVAKT